jgi:hypothetical protein
MTAFHGLSETVRNHAVARGAGLPTRSEFHSAKGLNSAGFNL